MKKPAKYTLLSLLLVSFAALVWLSIRPPQSNNIVQIGAVLPLSGASAKYGEWIKQGIDLAVDEINAAGGISGKSLKVLYEDDRGQPAQATSVMQKFCAVEKVPVVFGSWVSSCALAQAPIAESSKTVMMAMAITPQLREAGEYVFRIQPDARLYLATLVPYVYHNMKCRNIAIVYVNNDFGRDQAETFGGQFKELGGAVAISEAYDPKTNDFRALLTKVRELNPDSIFFVSYAELGIAIKQARELGIQAAAIGSVPSENPELIRIAGEAAEGLVFPSHFDPNSTNPVTADFQKRYTARYGQAAEGFAALAYDGITILAEALRGGDQSAASVKNFLGKVSSKPRIVGTISFDQYGDAVMPIIIKQVKNREFIPVVPQ